LICIPLPSIGEQAKIVEEVQQQLSILDEIEAQVDANLKRAARLRQGILKRAFEGRLLPQDPTDEPAEKLLERIRQQRQPATTMYNGRMGTRRARRPRRTSDPVLPFPQDDGSGQGGKP
jgi:type I restriction enzyme S subunit